MKPVFTVSVWLILACYSSHCQSVSTLIGGRSNGMGYSAVCLKDEWSVFNNIGGLSHVKESTAGVAYDLSTLPSANRMAAVITVPLSEGTWGAGIFKFGDNIYSEQLLNIGYSNKVGISSIGIGLNLIQYNAEGFGTAHAASISIGSITDLTPWLTVGIFINHINQPEITEGERLPTQITFGLGFTITDKVYATTEINKDLDYPILWRGGLEYTPLKKVFFRMGYTIGPHSFSLGTGLKAKRIVIDYAFSYSGSVGTSHQVSVNYHWNKR